LPVILNRFISEISKKSCATVWALPLIHSPKRLERVTKIIAGIKELLVKILLAVSMKLRIMASKYINRMSASCNEKFEMLFDCIQFAIYGLRNEPAGGFSKAGCARKNPRKANV
jgi:hypothetical protein